ncbi:hypothetical protein MHO82_24745 [Vibrio sp. Of7-15]|uniref:hypothetical protein n=1 Tax=Vibrio sp. Of7-15 TaxID=2724879 RepID=UPI001EF34B0D|nr:hypothetical protein [Vibrio sp. Of7-15]MCG7500077.1 hypothetical protein [Vibrio sp. Of7-15]
MIQFGLNALMSGNENESIVLLASAERDTDTEVVNLFRKAASELCEDLPVKCNAELWVAETSLELLKNGIKLPDFDIDSQFKRNLLVTVSELKHISIVDPFLSKFIDELGKFVGVGGLINDYQSWLDQLSECCKAIEVQESRNIAKEVLDLIHWVSYSATTKGMLDESYRIAYKLLNLNKLQKAVERGS